MYVVAEMDYHDLEKWAGAAYLLSLVLSTLVLLWELRSTAPDDG
ncbi:MAG: hypothetical protein ACLR2E_08125 [Lachnospiraceae bacterium]